MLSPVRGRVQGCRADRGQGPGAWDGHNEIGARGLALKKSTVTQGLGASRQKPGARWLERLELFLYLKKADHFYQQCASMGAGKEVLGLRLSVVSFHVSIQAKGILLNGQYKE